MGVIELFNTIILVIGITLGLMLVSKTIINTIADEYRKSGDHSMKLFDKFFDRIKIEGPSMYREWKKIVTEKTDEPDLETDIKNRVIKSWKE